MKTTFSIAMVCALALSSASHAQGLPAAFGKLTNMIPTALPVSQSAVPGPAIPVPPENSVSMGGSPNYVSVYKRAKCGSTFDGSKMGAQQGDWISLCNRAYQNDGSLTNMACSGTFQTNGTERANAYAERQAKQCKIVMDREVALESEYATVIQKAQRLVIPKPSTPNGQAATGKGSVNRY